LRVSIDRAVEVSWAALVSSTRVGDTVSRPSGVTDKTEEAVAVFAALVEG
jgi:hypothetical protein